MTSCDVKKKPQVSFSSLEKLRVSLDNALTYTLMLPRSEPGIRRFCLWALGMAVLTLRKIYGHMEFTNGQDVKISRRSVRATVLVTSLTVKQDAILRLLFDHYTRGLPAPEIEPRALIA